MPKPTTPCIDCAEHTHGRRCRRCDSAHRARPNPPCGTRGCARQSSGPDTRLCKTCKQWSDRNNGADPAGRFSPRPKRTCDVTENGKACGRPHKGRGMCSMHEQRDRLHGSPLATLNRPKGQLQAELRAAAYATTSECIYLDGYRDRPVVPYDGRTMKASRAVWIIRHGEPAPGQHVLHRCNGGSGEDGCINITHLYTGTPAENTADKVASERQARGEAIPQARLTRHQVRTIRQEYAAGTATQRQLAARHGVSQNAVSMAIRRDTWAWLDRPDEDD